VSIFFRTLSASFAMMLGIGWHQWKWIAGALLLFGGLFAGLFIPTGPMATTTQLAVLNDGDIAWMLAATAMVLFMTPGLAFFYGGMVRHHSVISTMLKCSICMGIIGTGWVFIGFSMAFGDDAGGAGFIGNPWTYLWFRNVGTAPNANYAATIPFCIYAMFQLKFAVITPALSVSGYIERIRFAPFIVYKKDLQECVPIYNSKSVYSKASEEENSSEGPQFEYPIHQDDVALVNTPATDAFSPYPTPAGMASPGRVYY